MRSTAICVGELLRQPFFAYPADMSLSLAQKIQALRRSMRLNQVEFGEKFGVTQGTVSRWEKGSIPQGTELAALANAAGVTLQEFLNADFEEAKQGIYPMLKGEVAAGVWRDAWQWEPDEWLAYPGGAHIDAPPDRRFGLRVIGESMNEVYPPGTILDCVHMIGGDEPLRDGQNVIVVRKRYGDGCETTVKQYRLVDGKAWLIPRSNHPAFQKPIDLENEDDDIEETRVIAIVKGSYRPE